MVNLTSKWSLPLFTDTDVFDPIQTPLGLMSTATDAAIDKSYTMGLPIVSSQVARSLLYPDATVKQGDGVYRSDLGYEERYFGAYNATTNPGGRTPAGWGRVYPPQPASGAVGLLTDAAGLAYINHGLSATPRVVTLTMGDSGVTISPVAITTVGALTATQIQLVCYRNDSFTRLVNTNIFVHWTAWP